jgi:hypothetical protein
MLRRLTMCVSVAALLLAVGCRSDSPVQPELDVLDRPLFSTYGMDCQMDAGKCQMLQDGIDTMKEHANPECRVLGGFAQVRFDAAAGVAGYREQPQIGGIDMGVNTNPYDNYTNVYPSFWNNPYIGQPQATGALIVHEEKHHQYFGETEAQRVQDACLNPQG